MVHSLSLGGVLLALWGLLSGHSEAWLVGLGVGSVILVMIAAHRMDVVDHEGHPVHLSWRVLQYWPWLVKEIVLANIATARVILRRHMPIGLTTLCIKGDQASELGHVILGNSITLTPGTVTIQLDDGLLTVHALTHEAAEQVAEGEMNRRVAQVEGRSARTGAGRP